MPLFFFHIHDGGRQIVDTIGVECDDISEARAEAIRCAGEMIHDSTRVFELGFTWLMHVRDEQRNIVCELSFSAK